RPRLPRDFLAALENDQRRNTSNAITSGDLLRTLGVELGESNARFELRGGTREVRRHRAAGPAPRGPEIDDHGDLATVDLCIEVRSGELDWMPLEEPL